MGLRILFDELEALLRGSGLLVRSGAVANNQSGVHGVILNSAEIRGGELFIGLKGEKVNGGTFAGEAIERGAALCLIDEGGAETLSSEVLESCLVVLDTLKALWMLAKWWIAGLDLPIVVITGSIGKTTVKELLAGILVGEGPGFYSQGSDNNDVGVPITLCRADSSHKWGVIEIGTTAQGEIARLSSLFIAQIAVITCVGEKSPGAPPSSGAIREEMLDIVKTLKPEGVLIINGDDDDLYRLAERIVQESGLNLSSFGSEKDSEQLSSHKYDIIVKSVISYGLAGIDVTLCSKSDADSGFQWQDTFSLYLPGAHNGLNVAAAVAAACRLFPGLKLQGVKRRLARVRPRVLGIQMLQTSAGVRIYFDCSNASPAAMHAFLEIVEDEVLSGKSIVLIMGEMQDLGEMRLELHSEVFSRASALGVVKLVVVGKKFKAPFEDYSHQLEVGACSEKVAWFDSIEEVFRGVIALVTGSENGGRLPDLIMVGGGRTSGFEAIVEFLVESFGGERFEDASHLMSVEEV